MKVFEKNGKLVRVVGRKGRGPGEFQAVGRPFLGQDRNWYVLDPALAQVVVFDERFDFVRNVRPEITGYFTSFARVGNGSMLFAGLTTTGAALVRTSPEGTDPTVLLGGDRIRRKERSDLWRMITFVTIASGENLVPVISSVQDSLWLVDVQRGTVGAEAIPVPELRRRRPAPNTRDERMIMDWAESFFMPQAMYVDRAEIFIAVVKGAWNSPTSHSYVVRRDRNGRWVVFSEAPPVLAVRDGRVYALLATKDSDRVLIGVFSPGV